MQTYRFQVVLWKDEDGVFVADVPALMGCHTQGDSPESAIENAKDAIAVCLRQIKADGEEYIDRYPIDLSLGEVEVTF